MAKFNVGDKVIRQHDKYEPINLQVKSGEIYTVSEVGTSTFDGYIKLEGVDGDWYEDFFNLYKAAPIKEDTSKHHLHHDLIIAWAKGAAIQMNMGTEIKPEWVDRKYPDFSAHVGMYRIKPEIPEVKPDYVRYLGMSCFENDDSDQFTHYLSDKHYIVDNWNNQLKLTIDGETGKIKSVEIAK